MTEAIHAQADALRKEIVDLQTAIDSLTAQSATITESNFIDARVTVNLNTGTGEAPKFEVITVPVPSTSTIQSFIADQKSALSATLSTKQTEYDNLTC